jgi:oxygen-independent coproporphyrinogen-3 oxidase
VIKEIDLYTRHLQDTPITSFYIGGGTPTTMLTEGLPQILEYIQNSLNLVCDIHMESHPNDLTTVNLERIKALQVAHLSIGVEALQDHHLRTLCRPYTAEQVKRAVARTVAQGFRSVNADFIFALPYQTLQEVEEAGQELLDLGVDQVAAYPLFTFPYTRLPQLLNQMGNPQANVFQRRKMLAALERLFYQAGYERTSVWAFTRKRVPKYCSVTVPRYLGLGASGGTYLDEVLYFNTFNVQAYITALDAGKLPIALSLELTRRMQMAGWLYWRVYETRIQKIEFKRRFGLDFDRAYGFFTKLLAGLGFLEERGDEIVLNDRGAYWLHALQDLFSLNYVSKLWGTSQQDPWPSRVIL